MSERGMATDVAKAGCARCQACSGLQSVEAAAADRPAAGPDLPCGLSCAPSEAAATRAVVRGRRSHRAPGAGIVCRRALSAGERADHLTIRHRIFVDEQAVFSESDLDAHDAAGSTIAVLGYSDGIAVGTVRLFPVDPAARAVAGRPARRAAGVPHPRARCAAGPLRVAAAAALGGRMMTAHIQPANVAFFQRLGWGAVGETEIYAGLPHQPMRIDLPSRAEGALAAVGAARGRDHAARPVTPLTVRSITVAEPVPGCAHGPAARTRRSCRPPPRRDRGRGTPRGRRPRGPAGSTAGTRTPGSRSASPASATPAGRGRRSRSTVTPSRLHSSSIASEPTSPGHADVLGRDAGAGGGQRRRAPGRRRPCRRPRSSKERKNGKSVRIVPSCRRRRPATGRRRRGSSTARRRPARRRRPTPPARRRAGSGARRPGRRRTSSQASCMPRSASRASSALPTIVSTIASGTAPIAARSLTLVRTAAIPAP